VYSKLELVKFKTVRIRRRLHGRWSELKSQRDLKAVRNFMSVSSLAIPHTARVHKCTHWKILYKREWFHATLKCWKSKQEKLNGRVWLGFIKIGKQGQISIINRGYFFRTPCTMIFAHFCCLTRHDNTGWSTKKYYWR